MILNIINNLLKSKFIDRICFVIYITLCCNITFGQNNETNNWNFGEYAGLSFALPQNVQLLQDSEMLAPAGCASISDNDGNLLFYTNSETVWNRNNNVMANGSNLLGNKNADQNSIIVPITSTTDQYYIFTVGTEGFYYSKVDMSLNNGLGEVIEVNTPIMSASGFAKISGVHHSDGESIWIMTTKPIENDTSYSGFYAYKVNTDGSIDEPIITESLYFPGTERGILKFSPDGKKIAATNFKENGLSNHLFKFNFDSTTGIVSDKYIIFTTKAFFAVVSAYGVEFSNDSNKLYASLRFQGFLDITTGTVPEGSIKTNMLSQYNLENNTLNDEVTLLSSETGIMIPGSLQLAKNGKIYRALASEDDGLNSLGVINNPNGLGDLSGYNDASLNLTDKKSKLGLPNFIQSYFRTRILHETVCEGQPSTFDIDTYSNITSAQWDFGDGNTSNEIMPEYTYSSDGIFTISVTLTINNREITVSKRLTVNARPTLISNQELIQCDDNTDGVSVFNLENIREKITDPDLEEELIFYETLEDAEQDLNRIDNYENYTNLHANQEVFVRAINEHGCFRISSFFLNAIFVELFNISDFNVCEDSDGVIGDSNGKFLNIGIRNAIREELGLPDTTSLYLYHTLLDAQTIQNEIRINLISPSTTIWVRAEESNLTCSGLAPVNLVVNDIPTINLDDSYTFCANTPITLDGHGSNDRYEWTNSNGEILSTLRLFSSSTDGSYTLTVYKTQNGLECSNSKTFSLIQNEAPSFENIEVDLNYNNNTIFVEVSGSSIYEFSTDNINFYGNSNNHTFYHIPSGSQTIYVRDVDQCEESISETLKLIGYPKFFTPNNDGVNDFWKVKGAEENTFKSFRIYNRYGKHIVTLNERNGYSWNGRINGIKLQSDTYWYKLEFNDGNVKTGYFTLKN